jgi:hypothetical protein
MKALLIITNVLFLSVIVYQNFWKEPAYKPVLKNCDQQCSDYSLEPFKGISLSLAKRISDNYVMDSGKKFVGNGAENTSIEDARSAWFSLEIMKKFIWNIEHTACQQKCKLRLGIRIYYAKYPDSIAIGVDPELKNIINPEYALHHTLFMVPTYERHEGNVDFDPWHWGANSCAPEPIRELFAAGSANTVTAHSKSLVLIPGSANINQVKSGIPPSSAQQNHGDLAPPPNGSGSFGKF